MSQHDIIEQDYLRLKAQSDKIGLTALTAEQRKLYDKAKEYEFLLEKHLFEDYIDFEQICDKLPDAIYVADKNGTTIYVNDFYQQLSGITKGEVIGENIHRINRERKLYINGVLPSVLKHRKRIETIGTMVKTNTRVYISGFPIFDNKGDLKYAVACDKDIQQLETIKDQLIKLKESQQMQESEIAYLRTQQMNQSKLIFKSRQMYQAVSTALAVAPTDATVLITGESGTGKEVITNQIYQASSRFGKPFLKINCAAIPDSLMESELFGYEPGAFTGASKGGKTGIFELANNGTLMLDEIGEMSIQMQTKLLRVLQNHEITRIGGSQTIPINVRIIAATNKNLVNCIQDHTFREDLYYRLNVVPIQLAPLRERKEDIEVLIQHFLENYNKKYNKQIEIYSDAIHLMESYNWPGNIRELENVIERLVVINQSNVIDKKTVSMVLGLQDTDTFPPLEDEYDLKAATAALERHLIEKALAEFHSKRKAAAALG
ncbi:MAG: sigma-54 interaction domain-containing protein, partial [Coprococcus sp.]